MERRPDYEVRTTPRAERDLQRVPHTDYLRVDARIRSLAQDPRPPGVTKLWDKAHRIRVGPWRVIYVIEDAKRAVVVSRVARREKDTYR